jgi:hypothetical protein
MPFADRNRSRGLRGAGAIVVVYQLKLTLPDGAPPACVPVTVAESCTVEPTSTRVTASWLALWIVADRRRRLLRVELAEVAVGRLVDRVAAVVGAEAHAAGRNGRVWRTMTRRSHRGWTVPRPRRAVAARPL